MKEQAYKIIETLKQVQTASDDVWIEVFKDTPQLKSAKKSDAKKFDLTPLKRSVMLPFIKDLLRMKTEIINDSS